MRLPALALALALAGAALAADITLHLGRPANPSALPASTRATLSALGAHLSAPLSSANTFVFRNVPPGSYLADIHCRTDAFRPLRVDVLAPRDGAELVRAWETFRGNDWANTGEELLPPREAGAGAHAFQVRSAGPKTYFVDRPQFSVLSILRNPMILMGLVSMALFFGMPKLMENMDPEMKAEFEAQQRKSPLNAVLGGAAQQQNPLGSFDMAAFLAGSNKNDDSSKNDDSNKKDDAGRDEPVRR
ncbi:uncharacterized protein UV8b_01315 [Ustilaginoidea virens]|uniref:ER membrane protein complex subunit 7 beta-sandwich domain-containing protein n=1 Tax=Ustilaginoidea virens TaxID=1159556 RepID=A0A8E5HKC0_USTVR|nr:uncharacterized protein UV8b_01315 [Ustilaginoidea virens]QUC17074.1 hypothetical protein UV8b_01315 [Ustilaginoidea virens]